MKINNFTGLSGSKGKGKKTQEQIQVHLVKEKNDKTENKR